MSSRYGLGRAGARLRAGEPLTVAFVGGSVTNGAAASSEACSYRRRVSSWLGAQHPSGGVREVNAALGSSGSVWGAFRARREVLIHDPDLVFVEFAVNDGPPEERTLRAMEGLLRQVLRGEHQEVCLLYAGGRDDVELVTAGDRRPTVSWHESLAEHYGIPSVEMALPLLSDVAAGRAAWDAHFVDDVHPTDEGMARYAHEVTESLPALLGAAVDDRPFPPPLTPDPWDAPTVVDAENVAIDGTRWSLEQVDATFSTYRFGTVLGARTPGAELKLRVEGSVIGILHGLGPDTGQLLCSIDGGPVRDLDLWDEFALQFTRPQVAVLAEDLEPGVHEVSLRVGADRHPDSIGDVARICAVLSHDPRQRP